MKDDKLPLTDLSELAGEVTADKQSDTVSADRARELYDVPSEDGARLAADQANETRDTA